MSPNPNTQSNHSLTNDSLGRRTLAGGESLYTIGDMARMYAVSLRTLRFYEDRGLIAPYRQGVARYYDAACRARLETILKGKQLGFTLSQIAAMLPSAQQGEEGSAAALKLEEAQVSAQLQRLERRREEVDAAIAELRLTRSAMMNAAPSSEGSAQTAAA